MEVLIGIAILAGVWCGVDISGYDGSEMTGLLAFVCPKCNRLMRDLSLRSCKKCGHVFQPERAARNKDSNSH